MSPKLVDIDQAVQTLKLEGSTSEMRLAARTKLHKRPTSRLPKYGLVGLTAGVAIFVAYPRMTATTTFAQALESSKNAKIVHYIARDADGKAVTDEWTQGAKAARVVYDQSGRLFMEWRSDGKKTFSFMNMGLFDGKDNPNKRLVAQINEVPKKYTEVIGSFGGRFEKLVQIQKSKIISQKETTTEKGAVIQYELQDHFSAKAPQNTYIATVQKATGLIVKTEGTTKKWSATYEYPETVDQSVFKPRAQVVKGVEVYDTSELRAKIAQNLKDGLGSSKGVKLRLVALDAAGMLWAFWTGAPISGKMDRGFTVKGVELGKPGGSAKFTTSAGKGRNAFETTPDGMRLYGMGREARTKIGDLIDVSVPLKGGGYATFTQVPVLRMGMPSFFSPWTPKGSETIYYKYIN